MRWKTPDQLFEEYNIPPIEKQAFIFHLITFKFNTFEDGVDEDIDTYKETQYMEKYLLRTFEFFCPNATLKNKE